MKTAIALFTTLCLIPASMAAPAQEEPVTVALLEQLHVGAQWDINFGKPNSPRVKEYQKALARYNLQKARILAIQFAKLTGIQIVLAENDPQKLAAQIQGMEKAISEQANKDELDAVLSAQKQRYDDGQRWWDNYQLQQQIDALRARTR